MAESETEQQFCLRWNNFQANITSQFEALRDDEDFVDVTLACGGQKLGAHKVVLSACSPYFKELFKSNPCRHPIIFMRDVEYAQVSSLLEFMYAGEVNIAQTELSVFLRTAEALQIRGLTDASSHQKGIQDKLKSTNKISLTNNLPTPIISDDEIEVPSDNKPNTPETNKDKSLELKKSTSEQQNNKRQIKTVHNKENNNCSAPSPSESKRHCPNGIRITSNITPDIELDTSRASPADNSNGSDVELNNGNINSFSIANDEFKSKMVNDLHSEMDLPSDIQPKIELPDYGSDDDSRHEDGLFSANALLGLEMVGNLSHALSGNITAKPGTSHSGELLEQAGNRNGNANRKLHSLDRRPCPVCGRVYSNLSNLRQHMRLIHNPEAVVCPLCKKIFKTKLYLKRHLVSFHHDNNADYAQKLNTNAANTSINEAYISNNGSSYGNVNHNNNGGNEYYNSNGSYDYDESNYDNNK